MAQRSRTAHDDPPAARPDGDFAGVFAEHHDELLRLAYLLCGDAARAEDLVADVFVRVHGAWKAGRVREERAYLRRALVNHVHSWRRRLRLERADALRRRSDDRGTADAAQQVVERDQVFAALRTLPVRQRTAIVLRYYSDLSVDATADAMGVTSGTVKASVSRALVTLRAVLAEEVPR